MDPAQQGNAFGLFFFGYVLLQIPGGYLAERWSAKKFVSALLVTWGLCAVVCGLVRTQNEFFFMRCLLGVTEGGVWPATLVLLALSAIVLAFTAPALAQMRGTPTASPTMMPGGMQGGMQGGMMMPMEQSSKDMMATLLDTKDTGMAASIMKTSGLESVAMPEGTYTLFVASDAALKATEGALGLELERLYNHLGDIGNISAGASYHYGTSAGLRMKEALQQLGERLTGSRFLRGFVIPGGASLDLTAELARDVESVLSAAGDGLADLLERIENNPTVTDRLDTTGVLPLQDAVALGVTGVAARASGVDRDARRDHPHAAYAVERQLAPVVATEADGDVHARMDLRAVEARESLRLVRSLLAGLPAGPIRAPVPAALPPFRVP